MRRGFFFEWRILQIHLIHLTATITTTSFGMKLLGQIDDNNLQLYL